MTVNQIENILTIMNRGIYKEPAINRGTVPYSIADALYNIGIDSYNNSYRYIDNITGYLDIIFIYGKIDTKLAYDMVTIKEVPTLVVFSYNIENNPMNAVHSLYLIYKIIVSYMDPFPKPGNTIYENVFKTLPLALSIWTFNLMVTPLSYNDYIEIILEHPSILKFRDKEQYDDIARMDIKAFLAGSFIKKK